MFSHFLSPFLCPKEAENSSLHFQQILSWQMHKVKLEAYVKLVITTKMTAPLNDSTVE